MSQTIEVKVPDIGDFKDIPIIEIFVKVGDTVKAEDPLVSLESDKATMDVPAPVGGVVKELRVKVGDLLSEGSLIMLFEGSGGAGASTASAEAAKPSVTAPPVDSWTIRSVASRSACTVSVSLPISRVGRASSSLMCT